MLGTESLPLAPRSALGSGEEELSAQYRALSTHDVVYPVPSLLTPFDINAAAEEGRTGLFFEYRRDDYYNNGKDRHIVVTTIVNAITVASSRSVAIVNRTRFAVAAPPLWRRPSASALGLGSVRPLSADWFYAAYIRQVYFNENSAQWRALAEFNANPSGLMRLPRITNLRFGQH